MKKMGFGTRLLHTLAGNQRYIKDDDAIAEAWEKEDELAKEAFNWSDEQFNQNMTAGFQEIQDTAKKHKISMAKASNMIFEKDLARGRELAKQMEQKEIVERG